MQIIQGKLKQVWKWMQINSGLVILAAVLGTIVLGSWGFMIEFARAQNGGTLLDALYWAIQLFTTRSGSAYLNPVPQLEIARYSAVAIILLTGSYVYVRLFDEQVRLSGLRSRIFILRLTRRILQIEQAEFFTRTAGWLKRRKIGKILLGDRPRLLPPIDLDAYQGHIVVCGAGFLGSALACQFKKEGRKVVVLEKDEEKSEVKICQENGILVLHKDAQILEVLRSVRVRDAAMVFILTGNDSRNLDIASLCEKLAGERPAYLPPLRCHIHIEEQNLSFALHQWEFALAKHNHIHFAFFNVYHVAGRSAAAYDPPPGKTTPDKTTPAEPPTTPDGAPTLLIIGLGDFGKSLLVNIAKRWYTESYSAAGKITIVVVDNEADSRVGLLSAHVPSLNKFCNIIPVTMEIHSPAFLQGDFLQGVDLQKLTRTYVCLRDEGDAASVAITLYNLLCSRCKSSGSGCATPLVIARTTDDHGMTEVIEDLRENAGWNIAAFAVLTHFCKERRYGNEVSELLAEATHKDYVNREKEKAAEQEKKRAAAREEGKTVTPEEEKENDNEKNLSMAPWEDLLEGFKNQNRAQADSLIWNLHTGGKNGLVPRYRVVPMKYWDEEPLEFDCRDPEIHAMIREHAIMEHERYVEMKKRQGYILGPAKDDKNKINPSLDKWEKLSQEVKKKDIDTIRELPKRLAGVYYKLERIPPDENIVDECQGTG